MSDSNLRYVGLDVHKRVIECCILSADGRVIERHRLAMSRSYLQTFAEKILLPTDQVALEATTNCWAVADVLRPHVAKVVVSNPLTTKAIAQAKVKTDKVDALVLAQLLRCEYLPEVWQPDAATRQLRSLTSRRASLVSERTRIKNRLHAVLAERLIEVPAARLFARASLAWLRELALDEEGRWLIDSDLRLLAAIEEQIARLDELLAALGDVTRFKKPDQAACYLGLVPSTRQSANKCYHGPITKAGRSHARWMLVQAAQHVGKHPGPLAAFFRRLCKKKNRNVAVVATARKLVTIAWHMLTSGEPYRYAQPKPTETKLLKLRVKATGVRRKGGVPKGIDPRTLRPPGAKGKRQRGLSDVYAAEGLPRVREPSAGERKHLAALGLQAFAEHLHDTTIQPRSQSRPKSKPKKSATVN